MITRMIKYTNPVNNITYLIKLSFNSKIRRATLKGSIIPKELLDTLNKQGYTVISKLV